ncbi:response regulator [Couchioplanes caeruleus]|uniref:response regulator n=1 Tax=Couchioplanes caeruleus TaxID=56438 RepID=UPI00201C27F0|nr:response regulator [Couchioplanes caeruleus]UQU62550.1 response regulator [Couchioplanes caeruleus]
MDPVHLLIIDDSDDDAVLIIRHLTRAGLTISHTRADTSADVRAALADRVPDVVISDYNMPALRAEEALEQVRACDADIPFILVSGEVGEEAAVKLMRAGAQDFVLKDRLARLAPAVQRELREATERRERRRAEAALRHSEERFRLIAEHAQDIIFRYRLLPEPVMEYLSPAAQALMGRPPDDFFADPGLVFRLLDPEDRPALEESWRSPRPGTLTVRWHPAAGSTVWTEQRAVALTDDAGRVTAVEGILRDVTERVVAEQERAQLERQLRQAERLDSLGQLAGGIAHDFNNLLAVISGYASMLAEDFPADDQRRSDLEGIQQAAARGSALTRQLLVFSRLEPSQPEVLDLNSVVVEMHKLFSRTLGEDVDVTTLLQRGLPRITMDRSKLEQVLMNAVVNARAAMPGGGRLTITTSSTCEACPDIAAPVCLGVIDTGQGMPPEVAARAFEPFFTTKGRGQGTGLGLATAYGIVTEAGGTIRLQSEPGHGTTLCVCLPGTAADATSAPAVPELPSSNGGTVLVVEDEDAVRDIVCRILSKAGYDVRATDNPQEALKMCLDDDLPVDALLTDVIMPGMSGTQLATELRQSRPGLAVLFMSGYTNGPAPGGHEMPADAPLIRKPFAKEALLTELHRILTPAEP